MKSETKDLYQILGIPRDATSEDVRKSYLVYAAKFHPDKHHGDAFFEERFREVKEAYEILSDRDRRWRYDIKKFGRSKVVKTSQMEKANGEFTPVTRGTPKRKFMVDVSHLEIYLTCFYLINLASWVLYKRMQTGTGSGGHILSLFLCGVSTMIMWLFIRGIIDMINHRFAGRRWVLAGYLIAAVAVGYIPLGTAWIP